MVLDPVPVLSGVPQGSVLGPVLFIIFISDLSDLSDDIRASVRLFADDCVPYRNIKSPTDCQILQDALNSIAQWQTDWKMKFNVAKRHLMRVTRTSLKSIYCLTTHKIGQVASATCWAILSGHTWRPTGSSPP